MQIRSSDLIPNLQTAADSNKIVEISILRCFLKYWTLGSGLQMLQRHVCDRKFSNIMKLQYFF